MSEAAAGAEGPQSAAVFAFWGRNGSLQARSWAEDMSTGFNYQITNLPNYQIG